jgi:transmembrane sensor
MKFRAHNPKPLDYGELDPVERAAAEWVLRQAQGLTNPEEQAFRRWLAADARHARVYAEMNEASHLLDGLGASVRQTARRGNCEAARERPWFPWLASYGAGAIAVAVLALAVIVGWRAHVARSFAGSFATEIGAFRKIDLPDGSIVTLNTDTAVDVDYGAAERRVTLRRGEAYFAVAKNPARPFWVQAGQVAVRAVGTAFNVRLMPNSVNVLVTEGKVRVIQLPSTPAAVASAPTNPPDEAGPLLKVGQIAQVPIAPNHQPAIAAAVVSDLKPRAASSALAWREGRLEFSDAPLSEVVAEFNRYNQRKIVIADQALAERRFGGAFSGHNFEPFLEILQQSFGVVAEERGGETVVRLAR